MPTYRVERWSRSETPDARALKRAMRADGYSVLEWSDGPGTEYDLHWHDTDQSHWIISGALELAVKDFGTVVLYAGDRDFMPAGTYHSARVIGDTSLVYLIGEKGQE